MSRGLGDVYKRQHLGGVDKVLIAPDGMLNLVPFSALVDEKDEYLVMRSDMMRELQSLELKLSGPDYPVESVLTKLDRLSDVLERGKRAQQKKVLGMLFESVSIDGAGTIKEVELQKWARPLFADLLIVNGDHKCPLLAILVWSQPMG